MCSAQGDHTCTKSIPRFQGVIVRFIDSLTGSPLTDALNQNQTNILTYEYVTWSSGMSRMSLKLILSYRLKHMTYSYVLHCFEIQRFAHISGTRCQIVMGSGSKCRSLNEQVDYTDEYCRQVTHFPWSCHNYGCWSYHFKCLLQKLQVTSPWFIILIRARNQMFYGKLSLPPMSQTWGCDFNINFRVIKMVDGLYSMKIVCSWLRNGLTQAVLWDLNSNYLWSLLAWTKDLYVWLFAHER